MAKEVPTFVKAMAVKRALSGMVDASLLRFRGTDMCLSGLSIVRTGTPATYDDKELSNFIQSYGGSQPGSVSGKTTHVLKAAGFGASKLTKATSFGTQVITEAEFYNIMLQRSIQSLKKGKKLRDLGLQDFASELANLEVALKKHPDGILNHESELGRVVPKTLDEYVKEYGTIIALFLCDKEAAYETVEDHADEFLKDVSSGVLSANLDLGKTSEGTPVKSELAPEIEAGKSSVIPAEVAKLAVSLLHNAVEGDVGTLVPRGTATCLKGKVIVRSGSLSAFTSEEAFENYIKSMGGSVNSVVTSETNILIKGYIKASKVGAMKEKKAKEVGSEVLTETDFYDTIVADSIDELTRDNSQYKVAPAIEEGLLELMQIIEDGVVEEDKESGIGATKIDVPFETYYKKFGVWGLMLMVSEKEFGNRMSKSVKTFSEICCSAIQKLQQVAVKKVEKKDDNNLITDLENEEETNDQNNNATNNVNTGQIEENTIAAVLLKANNKL